jgi:putative DNA primase/helicase
MASDIPPLADGKGPTPNVAVAEPLALNSEIGPLDDDAEIARLTTLSPVAYERERKAAAEKLGIRAPILDKLVSAARRDSFVSVEQGRALTLASPAPWPEPVDGAELMSELSAAIRRYVVMDDGAAEAVALWVLHAWTLDASPISPRLAITSPEKGCGKTTLLDVIARLVPRPLPTSNTTPAAVFRTIEAALPTLLIDEADTFLTKNDDLRGILNSGHKRSTAYVVRVVGDEHEPRMFSTWAPTAIAMIGRVPATLEDRSIAVRLRRRRSDEPVSRLRADRSPELDKLARKASRWAADNVVRLKRTDPDLPQSLQNRVADNWRPLIAIADRVGGEWPLRVRQIAERCAAAARGVSSEGTLLLEDIRGLFLAKEGCDRLTSKEIISQLTKMEGRPWAERVQPMSANTLARILMPFGICPQTILVGDITAKGYLRGHFDDAFNRYLPPIPNPTVTPSQAAENQANSSSPEP